MRSPLEEARRWERRAEENYAKAEMYHDELCRRTMEGLARDCEVMAHRAATIALLHHRHTEEDRMQSKSGLHPYRAALFFILREKTDGHWSGPKSNEAVKAGDVGRVAGSYVVRCIAEAFGKTNREVAWDLIKTYRALEDGEASP